MQRQQPVPERPSRHWWSTFAFRGSGRNPVHPGGCGVYGRGSLGLVLRGAGVPQQSDRDRRHTADSGAWLRRSVHDLWAWRLLRRRGALRRAAGNSRPSRDAPPHPLTPQDTYVTVTDALLHVLADSGTLQTVTLVPVSITPRQADRKPAPELLSFSDVSLHTYLTATEADAE